MLTGNAFGASMPWGHGSSRAEGAFSILLLAYPWWISEFLIRQQQQQQQQQQRRQ